jgi:hypothetical protein
MLASNQNRWHPSEFPTPFDDELVTFTGTASAGLTPSKVTACKSVTIRFISGDGVLRFSGVEATVAEGVPVFAGDIEIMSRFEAMRLSGIRGGATNLVGWATYYR